MLIGTLTLVGLLAVADNKWQIAHAVRRGLDLRLANAFQLKLNVSNTGEGLGQVLHLLPLSVVSMKLVPLNPFCRDIKLEIKWTNPLVFFNGPHSLITYNNLPIPINYIVPQLFTT